MISILTTRFNNETWQINCENRIRRNINCIYGSPQLICEKIDLNSPVFIIEMNNEMNQIEGIGLIKNKTTENYYKLYKDSNYNRFTYIGEYHISRDLLLYYNTDLVSILDKILFKGYTHSKRGSGFTQIPKKVLTSEICENIDLKNEFKKIFIKHFKEK